MAKIKKKCTACKNDIPGVEKWDGELVYCPKCFRVIVKKEKIKKEQEAKDWYNPNWTDDEYFHYVYDHFC